MFNVDIFASAPERRSEMPSGFIDRDLVRPRIPEANDKISSPRVSNGVTRGGRRHSRWPVRRSRLSMQTVCRTFRDASLMVSAEVDHCFFPSRL
jgi:hypothetical protein